MSICGDLHMLVVVLEGRFGLRRFFSCTWYAWDHQMIGLGFEQSPGRFLYFFGKLMGI